MMEFFLLAVLIISLGVILFLRTGHMQSLQEPIYAVTIPENTPEAKTDELPSDEDVNSPDNAEMTMQAMQAERDTEGTDSALEPENQADPEVPAVVRPAVAPDGAFDTAKSYTAETYQLVTDMVYAYRHLGSDGRQQVETALENLKRVDPQLGSLWEAIMNEWARVSEELIVTPGTLPEGLPEDDSLCIAVMGYHLSANGSMLPEMEGRCETALRLLERYPNAFLALTGGGTAPANSEATEAETMARWFLERGVSPAKMIVENLSLTTGQNAKNTCAILTDQYAQVKTVAVVSSDYHIAQCELLFTEAALLYAYVNDCDVPYHVGGYAAFQTAGIPEDYSNPGDLWTDIWVMADPHY